MLQRAVGGLLLLCSMSAMPMGSSGHSVVAEIAQQRLNPAASAAVAEVLPGRSLSSIASWADDVRSSRPETSAWHFVNIPVALGVYHPSTECASTPKGDCIVEELKRLRSDLRCAPTPAARREALLWTVHFLGDIHTPLHTIAELAGGNGLDALLYTKGLTCAGTCRATPILTNLHSAWDGGLIDKMTWDWGALVDRIEDGWLKTTDAMTPGLDEGTPSDWAIETHQVAQRVWAMTPANGVIDDAYFNQAVPILDRQIGVAGLRLARFLNEAYSSKQCPRP